jgi:hypothetical protein
MAAKYRETYEAAVQLIKQLEKNEYHATKFHAMRQEWVWTAMMQAEGDSADEDYAGLKVHLD